jgi:hypothetical protein
MLLTRDDGSGTACRMKNIRDKGKSHVSAVEVIVIRPSFWAVHSQSANRMKITEDSTP